MRHLEVLRNCCYKINEELSKERYGHPHSCECLACRIAGMTPAIWYLDKIVISDYPSPKPELHCNFNPIDEATLRYELNYRRKLRKEGKEFGIIIPPPIVPIAFSLVHKTLGPPNTTSEEYERWKDYDVAITRLGAWIAISPEGKGPRTYSHGAEREGLMANLWEIVDRFYPDEDVSEPSAAGNEQPQRVES